MSFPDEVRRGRPTIQSVGDTGREDARLPRVLFVSVNPFSSTSNNGKTFASFFQDYPSESLAQLYFHRELPTSSVCTNYFRITDEDLLGNLARPWRVTGARVSKQSSSTTPIPDRTHSALKKSPFMRLARHLAWAPIRLQNPKLVEWLNEFKPEVIVFCGSDYAVLYPKVIKLTDRYASALAFYITDDYVLPDSMSRNIFVRILRSWTRHAFLQLTAKAALVLTIGQRMSDTYKSEFGIDSVPVMNMVEVPAVQPDPRKGDSTAADTIRLVYAGSFHSNRWVVLLQLCESIERLAEREVQVELEIFGPLPPEELTGRLAQSKLVTYGGMLSPEQLVHVIAKSDVLVHVEADDPRSVAATRLSVSTKIPEYLVSGRCILAIGPSELASIDYLHHADAALTVDPGDDAKLDEALEVLVSEPEVRARLARNGFQLATVNHAGERVRRDLWRRLKEIAE